MNRNYIEQVKEANPLKEVVERYGYRIKHGKISCTFHSDGSPSMHIYPDGTYHCFGCGTHGDVISFVMNEENCTFKEAFAMLGGLTDRLSKTEYAKMQRERDFARIEKGYKAKRRREQIRGTSERLDILLSDIQSSEPFSDKWTAAINERETLMARYEEMRAEANRC